MFHVNWFHDPHYRLNEKKQATVGFLLLCDRILEKRKKSVENLKHEFYGEQHFLARIFPEEIMF